jgi:L-amino acid N-acyltransferase YncA
MNITIRHAEPEDYGHVIEVVDAWWGGRRMADMLPKLFFVHFRQTTFVAEVGGRIAGFITGFRSQTSPEQAYVHFVGVDPACRTRGIGSALYDRFFAAVRALGSVEVSAVTAPVNRTSIAFHAAIGFEVLAGDAEAGGVAYTADYDGPGEHRVRLRRRL